jgi:hypothetical protein
MFANARRKLSELGKPPKSPVCEMRTSIAMPNTCSGTRLTLEEYYNYTGIHFLVSRQCEALRMHGSRARTRALRLFSHPISIAMWHGYKSGSWCGAHGFDFKIIVQNYGCVHWNVFHKPKYSWEEMTCYKAGLGNTSCGAPWHPGPNLHRLWGHVWAYHYADLFLKGEREAWRQRAAAGLASHRGSIQSSMPRGRA